MPADQPKKLITPAEATALILTHLRPLPSEDCPLTAAHGRVLRSPVIADRPLPPFDRVTMDGFALRHADLVKNSSRRFRITAFQAAGMDAKSLGPEADTCIEIATGALRPENADLVIPYEDTTRDGEFVTLSPDASPTPGQNLHRLGSDHPAGATLLSPGLRLNAREIAVAATCGAATLRVATRPRIALVSTGDELVDPSFPSPAPHHVRRSNDLALRAALARLGHTDTERFHLRDQKYELETQLKRLISEFDVLILTGGVSKGKYDFLPAVLADLNVAKQFHGVAQRPGKPMWFGLTPRQTPVFALPGNPISTLVCYHRYVRPALDHLAGAIPAPQQYARLATPLAFRPALAYLLPVKLTHATDGTRLATPAPFNTSGDLAGLLDTDGFLELLPGPFDLPANTPAPLHLWE